MTAQTERDVLARWADHALWWVSENDCLALETPPALPKYLATELESRRGRAGRGRLWVAPKLTLPDLDMMTWPKHVAEASEKCGGIAVARADLHHIAGLPGFVTDAAGQFVTSSGFSIHRTGGAEDAVIEYVRGHYNAAGSSYADGWNELRSNILGAWEHGAIARPSSPAPVAVDDGLVGELNTPKYGTYDDLRILQKDLHRHIVQLAQGFSGINITADLRAAHDAVGYLLGLARRAAARIAAGAGSGWRDIATAPRDGTKILTRCAGVDDGDPMVVFWWPNGIGGGLWQNASHAPISKRTHWQPLPTPTNE